VKTDDINTRVHSTVNPHNTQHKVVDQERSV